MKMMYKILLSLLVTASVASAQSDYEMNQLLKAKQDSLEAKRGLEIGGSVKGLLVNSYMSSDQEKAEINKMPNVERSQFVTADLDFHFRPYDAARFNMILRFQAGMQNYFANSAKSISVAWLNIEGNVGKDFYWVVGDFRQQYSPLTLFSPSGIDGLLYEPLIFTRGRDMAISDAMIEGNQRNLQGVNLQFRTMPNNTVGEIRAEALMARLNRTAVLDFTGAEGNVMTNTELPGGSQASNMDKWLAAGNLELLPLNRNAYAGFTGMFIFDDEESFSYTDRHKDGSILGAYVREPIH